MREILGYEVDLARTLELEHLRLAHDFVERERAVPAAHQWDRAERAPVVAAFTYLHVANVRQIARVESHSGMQLAARRAQEPALIQLRNEPLHFRRAEEQVHFGQRID